MKKIKGKYINDIMIWFVSIVVYTVLIGFVCIPFNIDPFSRGNVILWVSTVFGASILKIMWGVKGDQKGKESANYTGWLKLTGINMQSIRKNATLEMKKSFCEKINKEQEQASILDYINENDIEELYNICLGFKKDDAKSKDEKLLKLKFLKKCNDYLVGLLEENSITKKQKNKLIKLFKKGIKYPKITIQDLNSLNRTCDNTILYDINSYKGKAILKNSVCWTISSIISFGIMSSLIFEPTVLETPFLASLVKMISIGIMLIWSAWNSYLTHITYIDKYDTSFLRRKNNLFCDFCLNNNIEFSANPEDKNNY